MEPVRTEELVKALAKAAKVCREFSFTVDEIAAAAKYKLPKKGDKVTIHYNDEVIDSVVKHVSPSGEVTLIGDEK